MGIFFHALWRSSSTYVFNKYRKKDFNTYWYYEPYHEGLATWNRDYLRTSNSRTWTSHHDFMERPYFLEFLPLSLDEGGIKFFRREFSYENFFPIEPLSREEQIYLRSLTDYAEEQNKIPVCGFCRSLGRVGHIRHTLDGIHLVQYRNPHEVLSSYMHLGFLQNILFILRTIKPHSLPLRLGLEISEDMLHYSRNIPEHGWDTNFIATFPEILQLHFELWLICTIAGAFYADFTFNVNAMYYSKTYRLEVEKKTPLSDRM